MQDKKILIVEDNEDLLLLWKRLMQGWNLVGEFATSAEAALKKVSSGFIPDLVMTDQKLHDMTGTELINRLRADFPHLRFLLVTGDADAPFRSDLPEGAGVLVKPIPIAQLRAILEKQLSAIGQPESALAKT